MKQQKKCQTQVYKALYKRDYISTKEKILRYKRFLKNTKAKIVQKIKFTKEF